MNALRQIWSVTLMNLKSLPERAGSSAVVVIGIAGVVGVLVSVMAMSSGLTGALIATGEPDRVFVLGEGSDGEGGSVLQPDAVATIMDAPGIATGPDGDKLASAELTVPVNMHRKSDGTRAGLSVRGLQPAGLAIRADVELIDGRMYEPGLRELIVGRGAQAEFEGLELGDEVVLRDGPWEIVGVFAADGNASESIMITDASTLQSAYQRPAFNSVRVKLESLDSLATFTDALTTNPSITVNVVTEPDYFAREAEDMQPLFSAITNVAGGIMALGALFAALNTMYQAVSSRAVEIATLRAIGFGAKGVVSSVLAEALALALIGAALGAAVAFVLFNGNTISLGGTTGSLVADMRVTPTVVGIGVAWAAAVGLVGGLFPAVRAARLPVATALRAI